MKNEKTKHPAWGNNHELYYINNDTEKLFIGTMPPKFMCQEELNHKNDIFFFYGSTHNSFWKNLGEESLYSKNLSKEEKKENRLAFIKEHKIGFADIVEECFHNYNPETQKYSPNDSDLLSIKPLDMISLLNNHESINLLIFNSFISFDLFKKFYAEMVLEDDKKHGKIYSSQFIKQSYKYVIFSSSSGNNRTKNQNKEEYKILY